MANLADDDLLLVQRTSAGISTNYSITGSALKEDLSATTGLIRPPVAVLTPLNGAGITEFDQYEPLSSVITAVGEAGTIVKDTDEILSVVDEIAWQESQVWSNDLQSSSGWLYGPTSTFDGVGNEGAPYTYAQVSVTGSSITFTPSTPISYSESISIYMASAGGTASVNGAAAIAVANSSDSVIASGSGTLTSLVLNASNSTTLMYIKVDGKFLIDAVDDSQVWSSNTVTGTPYPGYSWPAVFNNTVTGSPGPDNTIVPQGGYTQLDFADQFPSASEVEVIYFGGTGGEIYINYGETSQQSIDATTNGISGNEVQPSHTFTTTELKNIRIQNSANANFPYLYAIKVDGKLLVDTGVRTPQTSGNKILSFPTNTNFSGLSVGDEVQTGVTITAIDASAPSSQEEIVYATLDPDRLLGSSTLSNGNLDGSTTSAEGGIYATIGVSSGKWFWEITCTNDGGMIGVGDQAYPANNWHNGTGGMFYYYYNGTKYYDSNQSASYGSSYGAGDVIGVALDMDNGALYFYKNGVVQNSGTAAFTGLTGKTIMPFIQDGAGSGFNFSANFGQNAWTHEPPSGYVGLSETETTYTYPSVTVSGGTWDTSDQSQVWSGGLTTPSNSFNGGQPATSAFDGDLETFAGAGSVGEDMVFQPTTPVSYSDSVEVYISGHAGQIILNSNSPVATTDSPGWVTLVSGSSGSISSITIDPNSNRRATITAIRVDGSILIDAWNQSQVWSNLVVGTLDTQYGNSDVTVPFDGSPGPYSSHGIRPAGNGNYLSMDFGTTFANATTLKIYGDTSLDGVTYTGTNENLEINGVPLTASEWADNGGAYGPSSATFTLSNGLTSLRWGYGSGSYSSGYIYILGIEVDGQLLVDAVEDSQVWSNGTYTGTAANNNYGVTDLFANVGKAGDPFVANTMWGLYQATATFTLDNPIPLTSNSTLELITYQSSSSSGSITLTGSAGSLVPTLTVNGGNVFGKTTVSDPYASLGGSITAITIAASGADWTSLEGIIVDGKKVIDAGILRDLGDKKISSRTPYETSLTFTDTTELDNMVAPLEMADATGSNSLTPITSNVVSTSFTPASSFFNTTIYTGNSGTQTIENGIDLSGEGGLVWLKNKSTSNTYHALFDTERGTERYLYSNGTGDENYYANNGVTSFNSNGFTVKGTSDWWGLSGEEIVSWTFRKAPGFFDIVTWTGDGSSSREIPHNLGTVPGMILVKRTNDNDDWQVYHKSLGATKSLQLNQNYAESTVSDRWYDTEPTSTVFTVANTSTNSNGKTFIAYVFADNPSTQIKCGSYLGNATGGGTPAVPNQIDCGFRPKFLLIKNAGNTSPWLIFDDKRADRWLYADEPDSEGSGGHIVFNDTGFSLPTGLHYVNQDNLEHIFMAIGEAGSPDTTELTFQDNTSLSALTSGMTVTSNAASTGLSFSTTIYSGNSTHTGSGAEQVITTGVDNTQKSMIWFKNRSGSSDHIMFDTLRTPPDHRWLTPNKNWAEIDGAAVLKDRTTSGFTVVHPTSGSGVAATNPNSNEPDMVSWNFRAEPGFFDIVTWDGNNTNREIAHNLGSVPGFIMIKRYSGNEDWTCYHKSLGATNYMQLNGTARSTNFSLIFNNTEPTSTHFTVGTHDRVNTTGHSYIAYVFADNPSKGIKCGVYSGNSSAQTIDTGFKTGWVMVKQSTNDYKDWVIVDNVRGGGSGNTGKGLAANGDGQEFGTNLDFVSTGFELFDGSSEVNTSGQDYIYIAIAANPILLGAQATGSLTADADPSTNTASVAAASWPTGDSVTGPSVSASLTSILEISGNTIFGDGSAGTWAPGYYAEGSQINAAPPAPSEVTFTSTDNGTTPVSMIDATLSTRTWTLESGTTATGPWTLVDSYSDFDAIDSQDGATPWTTTKPTLQPNTYYRIKVRYDSLNADSVESVYNTFKTGDA